MSEDLVVGGVVEDPHLRLRRALWDLEFVVSPLNRDVMRVDRDEVEWMLEAITDLATEIRWAGDREDDVVGLVRQKIDRLRAYALDGGNLPIDRSEAAWCLRILTQRHDEPHAETEWRAVQRVLDADDVRYDPDCDLAGMDHPHDEVVFAFSEADDILLNRDREVGCRETPSQVDGRWIASPADGRFESPPDPGPDDPFWRQDTVRELRAAGGTATNGSVSMFERRFEAEKEWQRRVEAEGESA